MVEAAQKFENNDELQFIFYIGDELFSVNSENVQKITFPGPVRSIPEVPNFLTGLMSFGDADVPAIDLRIRLKNSAGEKRGKTILVHDKAATFALIVDDIEAAKYVHKHAKSSEQNSSHIVKSSFRHANKLVTELNLEHVLAPIKKLNFLDELAHESDNLDRFTSNQSEGFQGLNKANLLRDSSHHYVILRIGKQLLATELLKIREFMTIDQLQKIPSSHKFSAGIVNLRGQIIEIIDFSNVYEDCQENRKGSKIALVIKSDKGLVAFLVDEVVAVVVIGNDEMHDSKEIVFKVPDEFILGTTIYKDKATAIVDVAGYLSHSL